MTEREKDRVEREKEKSCKNWKTHTSNFRPSELVVFLSWSRPCLLLWLLPFSCRGAGPERCALEETWNEFSKQTWPIDH